MRYSTFSLLVTPTTKQQKQPNQQLNNKTTTTRQLDLEREIKKYAQEEQGVRVSVCLLLVEQKKYKKKKTQS